MAYYKMKIKLFLMLIILGTNCKGQINLAKIDLDKVKESTIQDFFDHMMENMYPEKIAKKNYYLFGSMNNYVLYGKTKPKLFSCEVLEIYKIDSAILVQKFPNYDKLSGKRITEILKDDIKRVEKLESINEIIVKNISFSLNTNIKAVISYCTSNNDKKKTITYKILCSDFSILK